MKTVAVVDYGMGNRRSVEKALARVGADPVITRDHDVIRASGETPLDGDRAFNGSVATPSPNTLG